MAGICEATAALRITPLDTEQRFLASISPNNKCVERETVEKQKGKWMGIGSL